MKLFEPIMSGKRVMLQSGRPLTRADIAVLNRRYPDLTVRIGDPLLDEVAEFENDEAERKAAQEIQQKVEHAMSEVHERIRNRAALGTAQYQRIHEVIQETVTYLTAHPKTTALLNRCLDPNTYIGAHTGNVFYLSMLLGANVLEYVASERRRQTRASELRQSVATDLTPLGLGAFFMDVALLEASELFTRNKPLSEGDRLLLENHPIQGADMLPELLPAAAKMIVRTHHETADGHGYPAGMPPDKQHIFTRIVRIADAYDAAISTGVFRQAHTPARVLFDMLVGPHRRCYDLHLVKAFARIIQPFPVGAKLRLQDGRYGVVVRYNRSDPFKPILMVAFDAHGKPLPREALEGPVTAGEKHSLRLRSFEGEDLSFLYDPPKKHAHADPSRRRPFETLLDAFYP